MTSEKEEVVPSTLGKSLMDYARPALRVSRVPIVQLEINPDLMLMLHSSFQFSGLPSEDPYDHIANFLEIANTVKYDAASDNDMKLRLFPFTLKDDAKIWYRQLVKTRIATWEKLAQAFLNKYCPFGSSQARRQDGLNEDGVSRSDLMDYVRLTLKGPMSVVPRNFEIDPEMIQILRFEAQFYGLPSEDPIDHIHDFLSIADIVKYNEASDDAVKFRLFPFTLKDNAKSWYRQLVMTSTIATWEELGQAFLDKYFPVSRTMRIVKEINNFKQLENESLGKAWERFKALQRSCPHHNLTKESLLIAFYFGLDVSTRVRVDVTSSGSFLGKEIDDAYRILEDMAFVDNHWADERVMQLSREQKTGIDPDLASIQAQLSLLESKVNELLSLTNKVTVDVVQATCEPQGTHPSMEQVNFIGEQGQGQGQGLNKMGHNPYSSTYNPGW